MTTDNMHSTETNRLIYLAVKRISSLSEWSGTSPVLTYTFVGELISSNYYLSEFPTCFEIKNMYSFKSKSNVYSFH